MPKKIDEDEVCDEEETPGPSQSVVVFSLGDEWYGLGIMHVEEVISAPPVTHLPNVPEHIIGIFNLRGNITSITDLKRIFGLESHDSCLMTHDARRIVVVQNKGIATGLLVDGRVDSHEILLSKIEPPVSTLAREKGDFIEGQFELNGRLVALLNAEKLIENTRLK